MTPKAWRRKNHYTQEEVAKRLHLKPDTYSKYEQGRRPWPSDKLWELVCWSRHYITFRETMVEWEVRSGRSNFVPAGKALANGAVSPASGKAEEAVTPSDPEEFSRGARSRPTPPR